MQERALEQTLVNFAKEHLHEEINAGEMDIIHRIGQSTSTDGVTKQDQ